MATAVILDIGDIVKATISITEDDTAVNPSAVVAKLRDPAGTVTTYTYGTSVELTRPATGTYVLKGPVTTDGVWSIRVEATTPTGAAETTFQVRRSRF